MRTDGVCLGLASLLWLAGCAPLDPVVSPPQGETGSPVWPLPPAEPRIAYVQSLRQPADAGIRRSGFGRFMHRLIGSSVDESLLKPFGIAVDEHDNLCLTDTGANAVMYFDRANKRWRRWEQLGKTRFLAPVAIAKRGGMFYVADSGLARVLAFKEDGQLRFAITERLARPTGLAIASERLWVTDSQRHCVIAFDLAGRYLREFGKRGTAAGEFNFPTHIAADAQGNLYVTDSMNSRVQVFDSDGRFQSEFGRAGDVPGCFSRPKGVAVDSFGHVYVLDANFDNFQIFDRQGTTLLAVGEAGDGPGQFWLPNGLAISRQNEIFVADSYNRRVQIFKYVGQP
jgi:DNA-binding beta-propeller fold protein YncE